MRGCTLWRSGWTSLSPHRGERINFSVTEFKVPSALIPILRWNFCRPKPVVWWNIKDRSHVVDGKRYKKSCYSTLQLKVMALHTWDVALMLAWLHKLKKRNHQISFCFTKNLDSLNQKKIQIHQNPWMDGWMDGWIIYLIRQNFGGQKFRKSGLLPKTLSTVKFCPPKILSVEILSDKVFYIRQSVHSPWLQNFIIYSLLLFSGGRHVTEGREVEKRHL